MPRLSRFSIKQLLGLITIIAIALALLQRPMRAIANSPTCRISGVAGFALGASPTLYLCGADDATWRWIRDNWDGSDSNTQNTIISMLSAFSLLAGFAIGLALNCVLLWAVCWFLCSVLRVSGWNLNGRDPPSDYSI